MSIYFNNSSINDWYFADDSIVKVYRNNAIVFYKVSGGSPTPEYKVCFAVVDDITQYQETEFEDVYDKTTNKWYKLNNLNQYEKYGVYGNGRSVTTYKGKLTIDEGYEYEWNGSEWVNVGEITGTTATLPDVPFTVNYNAKNYDASTQTFSKTNGQLADTDVIITGETLTAHDGYVTVLSGSRGVISGYGDYFNRTNSTPNLTIISKQRTEGNNCHMFANRGTQFNWMYRPYSNKLTLHGNSEQGDIAVTTQPVIESVRIDSNRLATYNNYTDNTSSTKSNFSYSTNNGSVALFAGYTDSISEWFVGDFYWIYMSQTTLTDEQVQQVINYNEIGGKSEYPKYYSEKSEPLDYLAFNTMAEAQTYAKANCVYDGMKATIDGDRYYFDSSDKNGWAKVTEYYTVEDVTPDGASGWTISGSSTYNPDSSYYDDFDLETTSTSNSYKIVKVTIYGYDHFTYYLRSYHGWSSSYGYVMATNVDEIQTPPTSMIYSSASAITNTYYLNQLPKSAVNLSNYRRVTYNNLDKTVEHTFYVYFYGYTYLGNVGNATILIPKEQTNENWEQVTFSASSNVASSRKNLYIDGKNSTSGGTKYWYNRWMIGLPSGSHTSYTDYINYDYCPNVTSSTFTSVAGEQRQVNFTYDNTTEKTLLFRLVDGNGNVLTPSDTVYYELNSYNSCNALSRVSTSFPRPKEVKVGGNFRFENSLNRHYIYGYSPNISFNTYYYVDNYQDTFDIVYTKLSDEAVTITYTTYDPSDTEVPAFKTYITYPYNGGTTSSTTLTSFDVPYTYPYEVNTNDKFSADSQSYTAGQTTRTINLTLYPNNREFASVADLEAYTYAWEGMKANVGDTKYKYKNGEWVEEAYTQYEYIQTQTGKYRYDFNTNFYPTTENTIEVKFTFTGDSIDWGRFICWSSCDGDSCDSTQFRFTTVTSSYAIIARKGNSRGIKYYDIGNGKTVTVVMPLSSTTYTYNTGSTNTTCNYNSGEFSLPSTTPMHIFNLGYASYNSYAANVRLHYVKVYDGSNNLVKHYVPSDNNGTPCLYEIVDGGYIMDTYTSSSHGTLTLGPEV